MTRLSSLLFGPARAGLVDAGLLATRLIVGVFLIHGVVDNVSSSERMREFVEFLAGHGFAAAGFWARISVYAQLACGLLFVSGLLTRVAALVCIVNFVVALVMVDAQFGLRGAFPSLALILFGVLLLGLGAGRWSVDRHLAAVFRSSY